MPRQKVKYDFIENESNRRVSYKKRLQGLLKKCDEIQKLCDVELAAVIDDPYSNEQEIFPNNNAVRNTYITFKELPTLEKSKNMVTREEFTMQRIEKLEKQLQKVNKENRMKESTNQMYELLEKKQVPTDMNPYDLNDLKCTINKNLKQVRELMEKKVDEEASSLSVPQSIDRTNFGGPRDPLLARASSLVSVDPLVATSTSPCGKNCAGLQAPLLAPNVGPISKVPKIGPATVSLSALLEISQPMFHDPMRTFLETDFVGTSQVLHTPTTFSQIFPPMVPQLFSPMPQEMAIRKQPRVTPLMPSTVTELQMPSQIMDPPMYSLVLPPMTHQTEPSVDFTPTSASTSINNNPINSDDLPQTPTLSGLLMNWNDDYEMTLLDEPLFKQN